ncbi:MAG: hypothetical protein H6670_01935 [Anaerolineaceae bacterium]|nr:hypothetical protein [Anaerolineaceae bacterium]
MHQCTFCQVPMIVVDDGWIPNDDEWRTWACPQCGQSITEYLDAGDDPDNDWYTGPKEK